jgi:hypothetical protein
MIKKQTIRINKHWHRFPSCLGRPFSGFFFLGGISTTFCQVPVEEKRIGGEASNVHEAILAYEYTRLFGFKFAGKK